MINKIKKGMNDERDADEGSWAIDGEIRELKMIKMMKNEANDERNNDGRWMNA